MIIYLVLLVFLIVQGAILRKNKRIYIMLAFTQLFLVSGLRSAEVGADTGPYVGFFAAVGNLSYSNLSNLYYEEGYKLLNFLISQFTDNSQMLLIVTSFIILGSILHFIYTYSRNVFLSVFLFITLMFYYNSMNILRQYIAMSIVLFSIKYIKDRKLIPFMLIVFASTLFHRSAIIFALAYWAPKIKFNKKTVTFSLVAGIIVSYFLHPIILFALRSFPTYASHLRYLDSNRLASVVNAIMVVIILLFGVALRYYNTSDFSIASSTGTASAYPAIPKENNNLSDEKLFSFLMLMAAVLSVISVRMSILGRVSEYFTIFSVVYIPNVISRLGDKRLRFLIMYLIMFLALAYNLVIFYYRPEWYKVTPYLFYFE